MLSCPRAGEPGVRQIIKIDKVQIMNDSEYKIKDILPQIKETITEFGKLKDSLKELSSIYKSVICKIPDIIYETVETFQALWQPFVQTLEFIIDNMPEIAKQTILILGKNGWYISLDMPIKIPIKLSNKLLAGEKNEVDDLMSDFIDYHLDNIQNFIGDAFPKRSKLLLCAFNAHKKGQYELSIPIFLSQSDGICYELIGYQLYSKKNRIPKTAEYVEKFALDSFYASILEPLRVPMPISANLNERKENTTSLNRHQILHGEIVNYGTRVNSCKAISLLNYICSVVKSSQTKSA